MGCWDQDCCLCSGPLENVRDAWLESLKTRINGWPSEDGNWMDSNGDPVSTSYAKKAVHIIPEDKKFWDDYVCVGPMFKPTWVSRPCVWGPYGGLERGDSLQWSPGLYKPYRVVHRGCLSILCRRLDVTPQEWWESTYAHGSYPFRASYYKEKIEFIYYDLEQRYLPFFVYVNDRHDGDSTWWSLDLYEERRWTLAAPMTFPRVPNLPPPLDEASPSNEHLASCSFNEPSSRKIILTADILYMILDYLVPYISEENLIQEFSGESDGESQEQEQEQEQEQDELDEGDPGSVTENSQDKQEEKDEGDAISDADDEYAYEETPREEDFYLEEMANSPTLVVALETVFSMLRVSKRVHNLIIQKRQDLFFRLIWQFGWMLPACPADWKSWNNVNGPLPPLTGVPITCIPGIYNPGRTASLSNAKDWRAYLVTCIRRENPHIWTRYRLHLIHMQHICGEDTGDMGLVGGTWKPWLCGRLGVGTALECPDPYDWEKDEWLKESYNEEGE